MVVPLIPRRPPGFAGVLNGIDVLVIPNLVLEVAR